MGEEIHQGFNNGQSRYWEGKDTTLTIYTQTRMALFFFFFFFSFFTRLSCYLPGQFSIDTAFLCFFPQRIGLGYVDTHWGYYKALVPRPVALVQVYN